MALRSTHLADKSALARGAVREVAAVLEPLLLDGRIATCSLIDLELLYSARSGDDFRALLEERTGFHRVPILQADFDRAIEVMGTLALRGRHRVALPDLIIAAVAERGSLIVLHYDDDFERIAAVTGQVMEWVVPKGTV